MGIAPPTLLAPCKNLNVFNWFFDFWEKPFRWGCSAACNTETPIQRGKFMPEAASLHNQPHCNEDTGRNPAKVTKKSPLLVSCLTNSFSGNLHKKITVVLCFQVMPSFPLEPPLYSAPVSFVTTPCTHIGALLPQPPFLHTMLAQISVSRAASCLLFNLQQNYKEVP